MTRSYQMHCTCDDLPSPLSYLCNHLWLWKQSNWRGGTRKVGKQERNRRKNEGERAGKKT